MRGDDDDTNEKKHPNQWLMGLGCPDRWAHASYNWSSKTVRSTKSTWSDKEPSLVLIYTSAEMPASKIEQNFILCAHYTLLICQIRGLPQEKCLSPLISQIVLLGITPLH